MIQTERFLQTLRSFAGNNEPSDDIELQELQSLLGDATLTDDNADNLEILLKRIQEQAKSEVPEWISKNVKLYLDWLKESNIEPMDSTKVIEHHAALAINMIQIVKKMKQMKSPSWPLSAWTPSTTEQIKAMAVKGPEEIVRVSDNIYAELKVMYETAKMENEGEGAAVSRMDLAVKKLEALKKTQDYHDQIVTIEAAYNKIQGQADKEVLAIYKFALKAIAALVTAFIVVFGWLKTRDTEPVEPVPVPSQPK